MTVIELKNELLKAIADGYGDAQVLTHVDGDDCAKPICVASIVTEEEFTEEEIDNHYADENGLGCFVIEVDV